MENERKVNDDNYYQKVTTWSIHSFLDCIREITERSGVQFDFYKASLKLNIVQLENNGRLLVSQAFQYANDNLVNKIAILVNLDIRLDESIGMAIGVGEIAHVDNWDDDMSLHSMSAWFLSRYEEDEVEEDHGDGNWSVAKNIGTQCGIKYIGSHDTIVFTPPLPAPLIMETPFELGTWYFKVLF